MQDESLKNTGPMYDATTMFARFRQSRRLTGPAMLSAVGSRAKTSVRVTILEKESRGGHVLDCGGNSLEPLAFFDHDSLSWKTCQRLLFGGLESFSAIFPRSGMMRNGILFPRMSSALPINETEFSLWATPQASDAKRMAFSREAHLKQQARNARLGFGTGPAGLNAVAHCQIEYDGCPTANFFEWLQNFPMNWTAIDALETPSCQKPPNGSADE